MFGENFGMDYYQQRHVELVQEAERARLVHFLEASRRTQRSARARSGLHQWALAAAGCQLVRLGQRMQQAAHTAH